MGPFEEGVFVDVEDTDDFSRREEFFIHGRVDFIKENDFFK